jgi:hypothetical protein
LTASSRARSPMPVATSSRSAGSWVKSFTVTTELGLSRGARHHH